MIFCSWCQSSKDVSNSKAPPAKANNLDGMSGAVLKLCIVSRRILIVVPVRRLVKKSLICRKKLVKSFDEDASAGAGPLEVEGCPWSVEVPPLLASKLKTSL